MLLYCGGVSWLHGMSGTFWLMPWQVPDPLATLPPPQVKIADVRRIARSRAVRAVGGELEREDRIGRGRSRHDIAGVAARVHEHGLAVPVLAGVHVVGPHRPRRARLVERRHERRRRAVRVDGLVEVLAGGAPQQVDPRIAGGGGVRPRHRGVSRLVHHAVEGRRRVGPVDREAPDAVAAEREAVRRSRGSRSRDGGAGGGRRGAGCRVGEGVGARCCDGESSIEAGRGRHAGDRDVVASDESMRRSGGRRGQAGAARAKAC